MDLSILNSPKEVLCAYSKTLDPSDLTSLVALSHEKADQLRYPSFLILQKRSELFGDVYPFWDSFVAQMRDQNSYQRNIGLLLLAENVRWDQEGRFTSISGEYLTHCNDEKFVTCRQALLGVQKWLLFRPDLCRAVLDAFEGVDLSSFKDSQQKLILTDMVHTVLPLQNGLFTGFLLKATTGGLLDKKTVLEVERSLEKIR